MRIFLTGFMGAGKTTVGRHLAAALGQPFVDLDDVIQAEAGMTVREIFERWGEPEFRRRERAALERVGAEPEVVVATGGGTVTLEANRELIRNAGVSVWIHPPFDVIAARIGHAGKLDRPLFHDVSQAFELYRRRLPAYRSADLTAVVAAGEAPEEVAARIALRLPGKGVERT